MDNSGKNLGKTPTQVVCPKARLILYTAGKTRVAIQSNLPRSVQTCRYDRISPERSCKETELVRRVVHMNLDLVLASGSQIRAELLRNAGIRFDVIVARIDEDAIRRALEAEEASPRDIADTLAEMKARKVSDKTPGALVLGCDQVLAVDKTVFAKPQTPDEARSQLKMLRNRSHQLLSAAVLYQDGEPKWRHVGVVRLSMRDFSDSYLDGYIDRNWDSIRHSVGGYKLEEEGVRLFTQIQGDYFTVLGLPLLELLNHLTLTGRIDG